MFSRLDTSSAILRIGGSALILASLLLSTGCSILLPAHSNSCDIKGERVVLKMLTQTDMTEKDYADCYNAFMDRQAKQRGKRGAVATTAAFSYLVGCAFDYVKSELEQEADLYTAQFGKKVAFDGFWKYTGPKREQNYVGFEVKRITNSTSDSSPAFRLLCAIVPSDDQMAFKLVPILFQTNKSKAKVLSFQWKHFYSGLWTWLLKIGNEINTKVTVHFDAFWVDEKQGAHTARIAEADLVVNGYDISHPKPYGKLQDEAMGWFGGIPVSYNLSTNKWGGTGTFWLEVIVTEEDPSNARRYIKKAVEKMQENRERVIEYVTKEVGK